MYENEVEKLTNSVSPDIVALSGAFLLILILLIAIAHHSFQKNKKKK